MLGQSLEQMRKDLRLMPTQALIQYKQNPSKQAIDGMPLDMLAGLELSRRAQLQQEQVAKMAPNPQQMPTVTDQAAMGLAGMAQQPVPQMPGAPTQFQSAPQAAPQPPPQQAVPQQMAQAPQPPALPPQPTQQQSQNLATGGITSLGEMQDARDQGGLPGMFAEGQPVQMMARGGIVAFKDNKNQPVDVNMSTSDPMGSGFSETAGATEGDYDTRTMLEKLFNYPRPTKAREDVIRQERGKPAVESAPPASAPVPTSPAITDVPDKTNMADLLKQLGGGGSGASRFKDLQKQIDDFKKPTDAETEYQRLTKEQMDAIRNRQSPEVSEADRKRIIDEQFGQNQKTSSPYYAKMQGLIDEERAATKDRYADSASNARLRLGLGLLGSRAPGFGQALSEAATPAMDYYDRAQELQAAANAKTRQADMDLVKARMSDEKGDREAAQRYFDSYQKNRREAEAYELQRSSTLINAQKGIVDTEGKRERAGMGLQMGMERLGSQIENNSLRNQIAIAKLMGGNQPKSLTVSENLAITKRVDEPFGNSTSPQFLKYVGAQYIGGAEQLVLDLKNKHVTMNQLQPFVEIAKQRYRRDLIGQTNRASGNQIPTMDSLEQ